MIHDFCVIGGGIVGLASAMKLLEMRPGASLVLVEKEDGLGRHQTGHNSGVIHSGIYYQPGSLKADLCRRGAAATVDFAREHGVRFELCGKHIVATSDLELTRLDALMERAARNGIAAERIDAAELVKREPAITGLGAIFTPSTGIIDYRGICEAMADAIRKAGGEIVTGAEVVSISEAAGVVTVSARERSWSAQRLLACAGLQSDRIARLAGLPINHRIVPFRGEYFQLPSGRNDIVSSLIYPVPDPDLPFLGIHLTRMIDGSVTVGPNAVLGFAREKYQRFGFDPRDTTDWVAFPGLWRTLARHWRSAAVEMRNSLWHGGYLAECRKYCPSLTIADLQPYPAGIRAQAVMADGALAHDFLFVESDRQLHVCNAPSPAATSAIPIGEMVAEKLLKRP
ncbi:L-2-hydroxyglutarate oxidase [Mesorhizobium australicum]|uniref:L-2-hydroxyglutarate oxidase n=1 Tax=Mesorhizobium australicum TaxID=536018 RepID=A0A1X7PJ89_9HYPH|nr:L-2-hydroxyglutarate oxidase [Mesorhizobium australicum]SMH51480.1 L-2-hydroxyglutarate oxidase [Mesorhizobium australicum]